LGREDPVILVGMRASGKTTLGRALARRLSWPFLDGDLALRRRTGKTPAAWLRSRGQAAFRRAEEEATLEILRAKGPFVAALGGGAILSAKVRRRLARFARVVWLVAPASELSRRIAGSPRTRPSLTGRAPADEVSELLRSRRSLYRSVSTLRLNTTRGNVDDCVARLLARLGLAP
jgi:shikimate kinase